MVVRGKNCGIQQSFASVIYTSWLAGDHIRDFGLPPCVWDSFRLSSFCFGISAWAYKLDMVWVKRSGPNSVHDSAV